MDFLEYTTIDGDRWDWISWQVYGDPYAYPDLIADNPAYRAAATLPGGIPLKIRVIDAPPAVLSPEDALPPWRR